jgi:tol-pal system protein YbgF
MTGRAARGVALAAVAIMAGGCEMMQPQPDPMLERVADLERRIAALERVLASGSLIELTVQVDELQRQTAELQGRTDTLEHSSESTAGRQRDLYLDLDDRIRMLEEQLQTLTQQRAVMQVEPRPADGSLPVPGGSDRENYEAALDILKQQDYERAGAAFRQFLVSFPDSLLSDNAQYWLAETYYVRGSFAEALVQFQLVLSGYPRSRKLPDALLKIGYSHYELGHWDDARQALERVTREFPDSTAATLASQRLRRMEEEGH